MERKISNFRKFKLLLWKNFMLQWNTKLALLLEIMLPVCIAIYIVIIRSSIETYPESELRYPPVQIDNLEKLWKFAPDVPHTLLYGPKNNFLDKIMDEAGKTLGVESLTGVKSASEIERLLTVENFTVVIEFDYNLIDIQKYPEKLEYQIRLPSLLRTSPGWLEKHPIDSIWPTAFVRSVNPNLMPLNPKDPDGGVPPGYLREGFIQIQHAIAMSYIMLASGKTELPTVVLRRTPYPAHTNDVFLEEIAQTLPFWLTLGFLASTIIIAKHIAREKELQLKEIIKLMRVDNWIHWLAWFVRCLVVLGLVCILLVIAFKLPLAKNVPVFEYADWSVLLFFLLVWSVCVICFSFMMAVFFDTATTAASVTGLVFFLILLPIFVIFSMYDNLHLSLKLLACLNLNFAQALAIRIVSYREGTGEGVQWSNFFSELNEDDDLSLGLISLMMLIAAFLYMNVCWYVEQVFPGDVGLPKKWNFFLKREFWCGQSQTQPYNVWRKSMVFHRQDADAFEDDPENARVVVEVNGLSKRFGKKWAVKNLSMNMFQDEITVLLGHNGAGKTATILMLAGMLAPTKGTAIIQGYDIRTESDGARASMGICLQRNVLFDQLSVANHLIFYSKLKGLQGRDVNIEVEKYLKILQLKQQANDLASKLSNGFKRKLALCCALIGNSKVVLFDEPTTDLDPVERRQLWDLLQAEKAGRTVLLTTHYMDDADVLGDRIAIMRSGELQCYGTSFFLKKKFGTGYRLICVKTPYSNVAGLTNLLRRYIDDIEPESEIGSELTYLLPNEYAHVFGRMLQDMEANMQSLGFSEFGIGVTSLQEVFLKVGAELDNPDDADAEAKADIDSEKAISSKNIPRTSNESIDIVNERPFLKKAKQLKLFPKLADSIKPVQKRKRALKKTRPPKTSETSSSEEDVTRPRRKKGGQEDDQHGDKHEDETQNEKKTTENINKKISSGKDKRRFLRIPKKKKLDATLDEDVEASMSVIDIKSLEKRKTNVCAQFHAMMIKKSKYTCRNFIKIMLQNSVGVLFVAIAVFGARVYHFSNLNPMTFSLRQYSKLSVVLEVTSNVKKGDTIEMNAAEFYKKSIEECGEKCKLISSEGEKFEDYLLKVGKDNIVSLNQDYIVGATIDKGHMTAWFNNEAYHSAPLSLLLIHNAIAKAMIGPESEIIATNHPLPFTKELEEKNIFNSKVGEYLAICLGFSMAIASAVYIDFIVTENTTGYKLLQIISGLKVWTFWMSHFIWDFVMLVIVSARIMITLAFMREPGYLTIAELSRHSLLLVILSFSIPPVVYFMASFFKDPVSGFTITSIVLIFTGVALQLLFAAAGKSFIPEYMYFIFIFIPLFAFTIGWEKLDLNTRRRQQCEDDAVKALEDKCTMVPHCCVEPTPFFSHKSPGILLEILAMLATGVGLMIYLILRDNKKCSNNCCKCPAPTRYVTTDVNQDDMDQDVKDERERVMNMNEREIAEYHLVLDRLAKYYGYTLAVNHISVCLKGNECFGLLGVNGSGKSTTFRMIMGQSKISSGDAYVLGKSVRRHIPQAHKNIGYCPDKNALQIQLTGKETLRVFCLIRGVPNKKIQTVSEKIAFSFGFAPQMDKLIKNYTNGNKRKLNVAIAMIGAPAIVILDGPSSSVDPASQRKIWNMIFHLREAGKLVVLTTNRMSEAEALCTKAAIMQEGEIKRIGTIQHLRSRFLKGIVLKIQAQVLTDSQSKLQQAPPTAIDIQNRLQNIERQILNKYPRAVVRSVYKNILNIYIPLVGTKYSELFTWLEKNRAALNLEEYYLSQAPLDEIFIDLTKS